MNDVQKKQHEYREKDQKTSRDWHEKNGLPVSVEKYGWEGRNYDSKAYRDWMSGTSVVAASERKGK